MTYDDVAGEAGVLLEDLSWGALWLDANNDGWQDLFIGTGTSLYTDYPSVLEVVGDSPNGFWMNNLGQLSLQNAMENVFTENDVTFQRLGLITTKTEPWISFRTGSDREHVC